MAKQLPQAPADEKTTTSTAPPTPEDYDPDGDFAFWVPSGRWVRVIDLDLPVAEGIAQAHGRSWITLANYPVTWAGAMYDLFVACCELAGDKPDLPEPKTTGEGLEIAARISRVAPDLPTMFTREGHPFPDPAEPATT
jgi:hypothetical protein